MTYSIVCAANNQTVLSNNLLNSPNLDKHDLRIVWNADSVCAAYNSEVSKSNTWEILIFVHQDVFLPEPFFDQLDLSVESLSDVEWGVLGVAGRTSLGTYSLNVLDRGGLLRTADTRPTEVQTLDELLLVVMRSSFDDGLLFDQRIPHHHLFGTDLCLQSTAMGKKNFVVDAFCHHNSSLKFLPANYAESEDYIRKKWYREPSIYSTCGEIKRRTS